MGKRDRRRKKRRARQQAQPTFEETANEGRPIPTESRTFVFRARGGVTFSIPLHAVEAPLVVMATPLTPDEVRGQLLTQAVGVKGGDA